jgi:hypothetical protein
VIDQFPAFVLADRSSQRSALVLALLNRCSQQATCYCVVDLTGELAVGTSGDDACTAELRSFKAGDSALDLWQQLREPLTPWLLLLNLDLEEPAPPWLLPGLDELQRLLWLAQQLEQLEGSPHLQPLVVLPPLPQALPLLRLARQGPDLLESLWHPLLHWWSQTRQKLAHLELVLRLQLPDATGLQLSPTWRRSLENLAKKLEPARGGELFLALDADASDRALVRRRLLALCLNELPLSRLWVQGDGWHPDDFLGMDFPLLFTATAVDGLAGAMAPWLAEPLQTSCPVSWRQQGDRKYCRIYAPGLDRDDLRVYLKNQALIVEAAGQRLKVPLPAEFIELAPISARVVAPFLEVVFSLVPG